MPGPCYVYLHRRATNDEVFYVGKGTHPRRAYRHDSRNAHWYRVVAKHGLTVEVHRTDLEENFAFYLERFLIGVYGDQLVNKTSGGEGTIGFKHSDTECLNRRLRRLGKPRPDMAGENSVFCRYPQLLERLTGNNNPMKDPEIAAKNAAIRRGKPNKKVADAQRGVPKPWMHGEKHFNAKSVTCVETGHRFTYVNQAVCWLISIGKQKATHSPITQCCSGKRKSAYGFTWRFLSTAE